MAYSLEIFSAGLFALLGAWLILLGSGRWLRAPEPARPPTSRGAAVFLFEGEQLVDASPAGRRLLDRRGRAEGDLSALADLLSRDFGPDLRDRIGALPGAGQLRLPSLTGIGVLEAQEEGGTLRVTLRLEEEGDTALDRLSLQAAEEELALLRGIAEDAPQPIWALDASGAVVWANRAYLDLADAVRAIDGTEPADPAALRSAWPAAAIVEAPEDLAEGQVHRRRIPLARAGRGEPLWFDVTSVGRGTGSLNFAVDVGSLVQAESARLHFVQALAKTFADLATGLAIFDRQRRLVLFNPAFVDLTGLPVAFLSGLPLVHTVLDRLREAKILPEPRDYASWREGVAALETAAAQGAYADTWTLPSGRTYRVTGRPHPDGALAFLFEDITDELGLTRRFRGELEAMQAALDKVDEAMAVFASGGVLIHCNTAYGELRGSPAPPPGEGNLADELLHWETACLPSATLSHLREGGRGPATEDVLLHEDGHLLRLRVAPLPHGARVLILRPEPAPGARRHGRDILPSLLRAERRDGSDTGSSELLALDG